MAFSKLAIVLPCHSMEDFPVHLVGSEATNLLAAWTSLWHPALIADAENMPSWERADEFSIAGSQYESSDNHLVVVPFVTRYSLDDTFLTEAGLDNPNIEPSDFPNKCLDQALIINQTESRESIISAIAKDCSPFSSDLPEKIELVSPDIVADFYALGYAYLQVQLMTKVLRYSSNLNATRFNEAVVSAAQTAGSPDADESQITQALTACFDLLLEEKNSYYPVQADLLHLVLLSNSTLGTKLDQELALPDNHVANLLMTGQTASELARNHAETKSTIQSLLNEKRLSLVGGLQEELTDSVLSVETTLNQFVVGNQSFTQAFEEVPAVFARRRFGLTPSLPGILDQLNLTGAIHATMDAGKYPAGTSGNIRWEGEDGRSILATGTVPLDAAQSESFLNLAIRIGEQIDSAHVATLVLAHWPSHVCASMKDFINIHRYVSLFGDFVTVDDYFESIYDPGYSDRYSHDEYRTPYLKQSIRSNDAAPVSRYVGYWKAIGQVAACRNLLTQEAIRGNLSQADFENNSEQLDQIQHAVESASTDTKSCNSKLQEQGAALNILMQELLNGIATPDSSSNANTTLINLTSFPQRTRQRVPATVNSGGLKKQGAVFLGDLSGSESDLVIDIPPMGSATLTSQEMATTSDALAKDPPILTSERTIRNEFFEIEVDQVTGGIRSINSYDHRKNLLTQQLAMRIPAEKDAMGVTKTKARYSKMVADSIKSHQPSRLTAEITSKGRLLDGQTVVAEFTQVVTVTRGMKFFEVAIDLQPKIPLKGPNHYLCSRVAFKDESTTATASSHETRQQIVSEWFHAPGFIELENPLGKVTLLTGGLPHHRRSSRRMVDSILMIGQESETQFNLGIAINVDYPQHMATQRIVPTMIRTVSAEQQQRDGWIFHFSCKNAYMTWSRPLFDEQGQCCGVQMRIRETEDRSGSLKIRCPYAVASASVCDFHGHPLRQVETDGNMAKFSFCGADYFQLQINWTP